MENVQIVLYETYTKHGNEVGRKALGAIDVKEISDKEMIKKLHQLCEAFNKECRFNSSKRHFEFVEVSNLQWQIIQANALLQSDIVLEKTTLLDIYEQLSKEYNQIVDSKNQNINDYDEYDF